MSARYCHHIMTTVTSAGNACHIFQVSPLTLGILWDSKAVQHCEVKFEGLQLPWSGGTEAYTLQEVVVVPKQHCLVPQSLNELLRKQLLSHFPYNPTSTWNLMMICWEVGPGHRGESWEPANCTQILSFWGLFVCLFVLLGQVDFLLTLR